MPGQEYDLPHMKSVVRDLPIDGLHDRMSLAPDGNRALQVLFRKGFQSLEQSLPSIFPGFQKVPAGWWRIGKFHVAPAVWLLAVRSKKLGPAATHIARQMLHDDRDRVAFGVQGGKEVLAGSLLHCSFGKLFVLLGIAYPPEVFAGMV